MPNIPRYLDGQPTAPLTITDEEANERAVSDKIDQRIDQLKSALIQLDATAGALTGAQIKAALRLLLVCMLGVLRLMRRRFDAVEE